MPLVVCATPIGNLEDVTLRVLRELGEADLVLCEDTRHTAVLLERHGVRAARLQSYHRHNEARRTQAVLPLLEPERRVAVCRELTRLYEEIVRGSAAELAERFREPPRGEITLVLGPADAMSGARGAGPGAEEAEAAVAELVAAGVARRRAADLV